MEEIVILVNTLVNKIKDNIKAEIVVLTIIGIFLYALAGGEWIHMEDDSASYIRIIDSYSIMPLYPLLIWGIKLLFSEELYLSALVICQIVLAITSTMLLTVYIQRIFSLNGLDGIAIYFLCSLPFCIYLPEFGITHAVLTEGITYALSYLFFYFALKCLYEKKWRYLLLLWFVSTVLALIRSQLMIYIIILGVVSFISISRRFVSDVKWLCLIKKVFLLFVVIVGIVVNVLLVTQMLNRYNARLLPKLIEDDETMQVASIGEVVINASSKIISHNTQLRGAVCMKGWFEAEAEDVELFMSPVERELFIMAYEKLKNDGMLYDNVEPGLYMWRDLNNVNIPDVVTESALSLMDKYPNYSEHLVDVSARMAIVIASNHLGRVLYHFMRLCVPGFIASVFFQIDKVYLICHVIAALLYLWLIVEIVYANKYKSKVYDMLLFTLLFLIILVMGTNLIFVGLQRYVVYAMGLFYIAQYIFVRKEMFFWIKNYEGNGKNK